MYSLSLYKFLRFGNTKIGESEDTHFKDKDKIKKVVKPINNGFEFDS